MVVSDLINTTELIFLLIIQLFKFIKNTLRALENHTNCELFTEECGDYYDNIYLLGHIAPEKWD